MVLTASTGTQPAWEDTRQGHGYLTLYLLEALQGVEEVLTGDKLSVYRLLEYVTRRVESRFFSTWDTSVSRPTKLVSVFGATGCAVVAAAGTTARSVSKEFSAERTVPRATVSAPSSPRKMRRYTCSSWAEGSTPSRPANNSRA